MRNTLRNPPRLTLALLVAVTGFALTANAQMVVEPRVDDQSTVRANALAIERESITVRIDAQHATTVLAQQYLNKTSGQLEGVCSVRAGQNTKVQGFAYWNGATKIKGEVFEKEAARAVYEQTTGLRRDPGLLEQTGEGTFSFRVFPIQPNEHKRVEVTLTQRLARDGRHVEYRVPLATPSAAINLVLTDPRQLGAFVSPTHDLATEQSGGKWTVIATPKTPKNREFVFGYDVEQAAYSLSVVKHEDAGQAAYLAISLATEPAAQRSVKDVTIVLDHSGSMSGSPLTEARAAAKEIVSRLGPQDRVNVIAFDDRIDSLYQQMQPATSQTRDAALRFLDSVQAGGGTDIALALREALQRQRANAERPLVLLLTDGESDAAAVFAAAEQDKSKVQVFTVGLGSGVNRPLLSRLSDMKRGRFTYIQSADAIRSSVSHLFNLVESAALKDPQIEVENGQLTQMQPSTLPDLAPGEELLVTARAIGSGPMRIVVKGTSASGPVAAQTTVPLGQPSSSPWVGRLWAQDRTNRLLEDISLKGETDERKNEVIELAIGYGFVTPYTSFLAIPESELSAVTSSLMRDMRAQKKAILAKRADAVALSRSEMPPGDPVLSVDAPADALRVTAFFPFGLEKELNYDPETKRWRVRFLVPKEVVDGTYAVPVMVITRDGHVQFLTGHYTIDSQSPEFEPEVECRTGTMFLTVTTNEPMREVRAALVTDPTKRATFVLEPGSQASHRYTARIKLPRNEERVRVVVADRARNEAEEVVSCPGGR